MKLKNVVCAHDFSEQSERALKLAASLARESGAVLHIIHCHEEPFAYDPQLVESVVPPDLEEARKHLEEVSLPDTSLTIVREFITGVPADSILDYADKVKADMIVMGTHGRTGLARLLMGSVAEVVLRSARCPVLVVKQPTAEEA